MQHMVTASPWVRYQELQRYVAWSDDDTRRVSSIGPLVEPFFGELIDDFYDEIERHPEARKVITGGQEQINRLKRTLMVWLGELFSGCYDHDYVERRWRVGYRHVEIGLDQVYTNAALSRLRGGLLTRLDPAWKGSARELIAARQSLNTLIDLDLAIIEDAYQTEYRRRQLAAERLATIGKVAGGIAHELRNPLNVIKTSVYYLLNASQASPEKIASHLQRIERQVGVADRVITALNDFARLPIPEIAPVDVESCLSETLELVSMPPNIEVNCEVQPQAATVLSDRAQLQIVLSNLIRNARDAMPQGGALSIQAVREGEQVAISVQDSGAGIAPADLPHILEPLYSTKAKGIGLGLSIAHDIVRRHQGSLSVQSEPGQGARFVVRLNAGP